jgi:hypothetical protein
VDLDVILVSQPFQLTESPVFKATGSHLFRDQRCYWGSSWDCQLPLGPLEAYREALKASRRTWQWPVSHARTNAGVFTHLSAALCPPRDRQAMVVSLDPTRGGGDLPAPLASSPPFTGFSYDVGESAVVLMDKVRNRAAVDILRRVLGPDRFAILWDHVHGDKVRRASVCVGVVCGGGAELTGCVGHVPLCDQQELPWLSMAYAGATPGLNPFAWVAVGPLNHPRTGEDGVMYNVTSAFEHTLAQWATVEGATRILYLNGDGVETLMSDLSRDPTSLYVGASSKYEETPCYADYSSVDVMPLPPEVVESIGAYRSVWQRAVKEIP